MWSEVSPDPVVELVRTLAKALVDFPQDVRIQEVGGRTRVVIEVEVHPRDLGKIVGRQGANAEALRTLVKAAGGKQHKRYTLVILDERS
jgi:predicted RNA-binding protein YlqC (UPF0109 family)